MARVLVIESDDRLRNLLRAFLLTHGFRVSLARDAESARDCLVKEGADVLLLELDGSGTSPELLLSGLRSAIPHPPPIVAISTDTLSPGQRRALGFPVLQKPFDADELMLLLTDAVERAGHRS